MYCVPMREAVNFCNPCFNDTSFYSAVITQLLLIHFIQKIWRNMLVKKSDAILMQRLPGLGAWKDDLTTRAN